MNRIRLLSEQVANQIAAGEVVERPASVVKELVENALDAQSSRITVEIQAGGRSLIRVTDDGVGMSRDDALLCLERHATSKLHTADDLNAIRTMGFRGEAVPSIASVSRMNITTRERDGEREAGTQIVIHGGRIIEVKDAGSAPGTSVEVRNLFFNLPARRKFLRSEETERAHIQHYLNLAALAYPEVAMNFLDDKRVVWQLPQACVQPESGSDLAALQERLRGLYGSELKLLSVDSLTNMPRANVVEEDTVVGESSLRVWGFIGAPGVSRSTRDEQNVFVNRRPVENRGLNFALMEGYHTSLMKGRYPVCCLFLEIDPAAVDVNIHPAKREVKFHQEQWVRRCVMQAVRDTLLTYHTKPGEPLSVSPAPVGSQPTTPSVAVDLHASSAASSAASPGLHPQFASSAVTKPLPPAEQRDNTTAEPTPNEPDLPELGHSTRIAMSVPPAGTTSASTARTNQPPASASQPVPLLNVPLRIVGVIGQLYVVLESDRGLVLLDQHAAHERILYEQMLRRLEQQNAPSQRLLLPETIELSPRDAQFLREQLPSLVRLGVGLSEFGDRTFLLDALPPFVRATAPRRFVLELVDALKAAGDGVNPWRLGEHTVAKTVCRHAVKANDPLAGAELESLVRDLRHCEMPYTCPHGRPTLIEMSYRDLEKKFGRAQ